MAPRSVVAFYTLACAITWAFHGPLALVALGLVDLRLPPWLHLLGALGPLVSALVVTAVTDGRAGLRELGSRLTRWNVGVGFLAFALLSPGAVFVVAGSLVSLVRGDASGLAGFGYASELPTLGWAATWLLWTLSFGFCEELGWRGFLLPRLQATRGAYVAALQVGLLWAFWHLPSFAYNLPPHPSMLLAFLVSVLAGSVVMTWLTNGTGGSLLVPALWHGAVDTAVAGADGLVAAAVNACVIGLAIGLVRHYGPETLSAGPKWTGGRTTDPTGSPTDRGALVRD